jgi:flagellar motility protein MotE (MotC chaperone)
MPSEPTMTDASPTLGDTAPTVATRADDPHAPADAHGDAPEAAAEGEHGNAAAEGDHGEGSASGEHGEAAADPHAPADPHASSEDVDVSCIESPRTGHETPTELTDNIGAALAVGCPPPPTPVNEFGDALPTTKDGNGKIVPLAVAEGDNAEQAILARLGERRAELDKLATDLEIRTALIEAAEKRLDERAKALAELEAQVNALVDEKQVTEDAGFKAVVSMYETMKPKDAAAIFDTLETEVLLRVVRAMNPRKMAPVLAAMSTKPAEELTTALASKGPSNMVADAGTSAADLPQIVGQ